MRSSIYVVLFSFLMLVASAFAQEDADEALPTGEESALEQEESGDDESSGEETVASDEESQSSDEEATADPYANTTKGKISRDGKNWLLNGMKVDREIIAEELNSNSKSASEYRTYQVFCYPGMVLAGIGGFALAYGIISWSTGEDFGMPVTLAGAGVAGVGVVLYYISGKYFNSAIQIYNREAGYETSLQLQVVPTPQGGLALALAF